jgi:hypothetical protein
LSQANQNQQTGINAQRLGLDKAKLQDQEYQQIGQDIGGAMGWGMGGGFGANPFAMMMGAP